MTLRVVGAGIGRTGTHSLKIALEQLLGAPCYHMMEVFAHPEHVPIWQDAVDDKPVDWEALMSGFAAAVDWPPGGWWRELAAANPDAIILLSTRDADSWWRSADQTIFALLKRGGPPMPMEGADKWHAMVMGMLARFDEKWDDEASAKAAFERHNAAVRAEAPPDRLVEWHPGDGWEPICTALGIAVPDTPFPHVNSTEDFRANAGLDQ